MLLRDAPVEGIDSVLLGMQGVAVGGARDRLDDVAASDTCSPGW